jgi:hypothetical protein
MYRVTEWRVDSRHENQQSLNARPRRVLPRLEPFYYLKNFELVLSTVRERYADLLSAQESGFIADFVQLPPQSRALLVRMVMRRGELFKGSKLNYVEIGDTRAAVQPLVDKNWVNDRPALNVEDLQSILTKSELIRAGALPPRHAADWPKAAIVSQLRTQCPDTKTFDRWWPASTDTVYRLLTGPICERFRLLFFGNYRQTWSDFVTADLNIFTFEKVDQSLQCRPFQTRAQIVVCEQVQECGVLLEEGMPLDDLVRLIPEPVTDCDWLEDARQKLLFRIARECERCGDIPRAISMYSGCTHRGARSRLIRLLSRAREWEASRALCLLARAAPESDEELQHALRILPRVHKKLGIPWTDACVAPRIPEFNLVFGGARGPGAVEYHVRDHLAHGLGDPSTVRYVENGLINALFGLLCWPAIFAAVPGAFVHDFQRGPVDLASGHFHRRRQRQFEACLSELESDRYRRSIWKTFDSKWGIQSPFVRWSAVDKTLLRWALDCFPAAHLRYWFEWILRNVEDNRAGFPDLVQFWPEERRYRLIEVKGPGDRVQDNQRRLLEYCVLHGMPVAVCYARWTICG